MSTKIYPVKNFILVTAVVAEEQEISDGLIMPQSADESANLRKVEVVEIGDSVGIPNVKVGTTLVVPSNLRNEIKVNGKSYFLVHEEEVLAYEE
jgi:co-chaperonin GroES (HSP10)